MSNINVPIYDLSNPYFLYQDIEAILSNIGRLYEIDFSTGIYRYSSKTKVPENASWFSNETTRTFNELVPKLKSLVKDMYSIIEGIYVAKTGTFKKIEIENKYINLRELREINNKFKHHHTKTVSINFVSTTDIKTRSIDCIVRFDYANESKTIQISDLINVFLKVLENNEVIKIDN